MGKLQCLKCDCVIANGGMWLWLFNAQAMRVETVPVSAWTQDVFPLNYWWKLFAHTSCSTGQKSKFSHSYLEDQISEVHVFLPITFCNCVLKIPQKVSQSAVKYTDLTYVSVRGLKWTLTNVTSIPRFALCYWPMASVKTAQKTECMIFLPALSLPSLLSV